MLSVINGSPPVSHRSVQFSDKDKKKIPKHLGYGHLLFDIRVGKFLDFFYPRPRNLMLPSSSSHPRIWEMCNPQPQKSSKFEEFCTFLGNSEEFGETPQNSLEIKTNTPPSSPHPWNWKISYPRPRLTLEHLIKSSLVLSPPPQFGKVRSPCRKYCLKGIS